MELQKEFFNRLKEKLSPNVSLVHEVSELLEISYDSAYRRIRGEKELTFMELHTLCTHFGISVDSLFSVKHSNVIFNCHSLSPEIFELRDWLSIIHNDIKKIHAARDKEIIYAAKDPPVFHYFQFPEIAAFKAFFWQKTLFQFPEYQDKQFRLDEGNPELFNIGRGILATSTKIPTIEIWNEDTFNITLRQIEYYWISGYFRSKDDILNLCDKLEKWIRHIRHEAECGFKYLYGTPAEGIENSFKLYENEVVLNDNTIYVNLDGDRTIYLTFNVLSLLTTTDPKFSDFVERYMRGLLKKSILISVSNDKERNRFFNKLLGTIERFKERID